jgi:hypothetical protein
MLCDAKTKRVGPMAGMEAFPDIGTALRLC